VSERIPAELFHPGELLAEELKERGLTQTAFAREVGYSQQHISDICRGRRDISPVMALALGLALGTSADLWWNLQAAYDLHQARRRFAVKGEAEG
jgi:addiction module HigA family antidote